MPKYDCKQIKCYDKENKLLCILDCDFVTVSVWNSECEYYTIHLYKTHYDRQYDIKYNEMTGSVFCYKYVLEGD